MASLLGQHDRIVLGDEHDSGPEEDPLSHRRGCGERDHRIEAPPVVVDRDSFDQRRRSIRPYGKMGVFGQVERVRTRGPPLPWQIGRRAWQGR